MSSVRRTHGPGHSNDRGALFLGVLPDDLAADSATSTYDEDDFALVTRVCAPLNGQSIRLDSIRQEDSNNGERENNGGCKK